LIEAGAELPVGAVIVRDVGINKMRKDCEGQISGPSAAALFPRLSDSYLSVTWCGFFHGTHNETLRCAAQALCQCRSIKKSAFFCFAEADAVVRKIQEEKGPSRVVYYPEDTNPAHAGVHGLVPDDDVLCEMLAEEVWFKFVQNSQVSELPESDCTPANIE
jgi:hypothetical protein